MLSVEQNQRLTQVSAGTPMGELMRRYWQPVAVTVELKENPTKSVRILGEDLVLYKDRSGTLGLIDESCPHRRVNLLYGIPEEKGLRCPYHGWLMDETGQCIEMPAEAPDSTFKDRVKVRAYPVQELGGLIWAYLGPDPVPLVPRWDLFVSDNMLRDIGVTVIPCNWLQCMENSLDPIHTEWLHSYQSNYVLELEGVPAASRRRVPHHSKIGFDVHEIGIYKRRMYEGGSEEDGEWRKGHPIIFPHYLRVGMGFQMRIPIDDTHTWHINYNTYSPPANSGIQVPPQEEIPMYEVPFLDERTGRAAINFTIGQDSMAWWTQGPLAQREVEKLAESDKGIILYRRLLKEQMQIVTDGGDPLNVYRDPAKNVNIYVVHEGDAREPKATPSTPRTGTEGGGPSPMSGQIHKETGKAVMGPTGAHSPMARLAPDIFAKLAKETALKG
jgi:5,5'-dehydrodivanillate O-demethylase